MYPNASNTELVNSLIEIAAKGTALPNPCLTNTTVSQVNLTSTADNTDNS